MRVGERDGSSLDGFASFEDAHIEVIQGFQPDVVRGAVPVVADEEPDHRSSQFRGYDELSDFVRRQGAVRVCAFICEVGCLARVPWHQTVMNAATTATAAHTADIQSVIEPIFSIFPHKRRARWWPGKPIQLVRS